MDPAPTKLDTSLAAVDYVAAVDQLLHLYTNTDKAAAALPTASVVPFFNYFWNIIKFDFALIADALLIVPINIIVFIRNIFPGRWPYKCFSCQYFKIVASWIWMGECTIPLIHFRPIVTSLLHWHFRSHLSALRNHILLETGFSEDRTKTAIDKIDRAMQVWQQRITVRSAVFTWLLPLIGPATYVWNWFVPASLMPSFEWTRFAVIISVSYTLSILATGFSVKRGLMLGEKGTAAWYPGFVPGQGGYGQEKAILNALGLQLSEFPFDITILLGSSVLTLLTYSYQLEFYTALGSLSDQPHMFASIAIPQFVLFVVLVVSWFRRKKLGRL